MLPEHAAMALSPVPQGFCPLSDWTELNQWYYIKKVNVRMLPISSAASTTASVPVLHPSETVRQRRNTAGKANTATYTPPNNLQFKLIIMSF